MSVPNRAGDPNRVMGDHHTPLVRLAVNHPDIQDTYHPDVKDARRAAGHLAKHFGAEGKTRYSVYEGTNKVREGAVNEEPSFHGRSPLL